FKSAQRQQEPAAIYHCAFCRTQPARRRSKGALATGFRVAHTTDMYGYPQVRWIIRLSALFFFDPVLAPAVSSHSPLCPLDDKPASGYAAHDLCACAPRGSCSKKKPAAFTQRAKSSEGEAISVYPLAPRTVCT